MKFNSDIFLSYAHIDNQPLSEGQRGWITNLQRALQVRVGQLLGKEPKIWRDAKLQGNDVFADTLLDQLPGVALLVSVFSPRYLRSEWCARELQAFLDASQDTGGLQVGDKIRVFKVIKTPIPRGEDPLQTQAVLGYEFYTIDPQTGRPNEFGQQDTPEDMRQYWARLEDLAYDICDTLRLLENENGGSAGREAEPEGGAGKVVYLAEASFDLKTQRDAVRRELIQHGHTVLPDRSLPLEVTELAEIVQDQLARCDLSVHLVGESYGVVPDGTDRSLVVLQNEIAAASSATEELPRFLWMPPDLASGDSRQASFIEWLRTDSQMQVGADLLETPLEDLKTAIHRRLTPPRKPPETEPEVATGNASAGHGEDDLIRIYLICDQGDLDHTADLEDHLFDQGYEIVVPAFEGDETHLRQDHEENLCLCDAILIYFGAGSNLWLRSKLREVQKSAGFGRDRPLLSKAIYVAPPMNSQKQRLRTREAMVIQGGESFEPTSLEPFVGQITQAQPDQS